MAKYTHLTIVTRLHGPWFIHGPIMNRDNDSDYQLRIKMEGEAIRASTGITSPSLDVLEQVRSFYGLELPDAEVIPNPVNTCPVDKQWSVSKLKSVPTVLVVARFDLHKGGDIALEAFRLLALENGDAELVFVGPDRGVTIEGKKYSFNQYVDVFIPEETVKSRIRFLGAKTQSEIEKLRATCHVTLVTSRYDNFPMSLLEAVSTGSPVVGVKVGGIKEIIIDEQTGLLAESENVESIADCLKKLLSDMELMTRLSRNAVQDSALRFSPETVAKQTLDFYNKIV